MNKYEVELIKVRDVLMRPIVWPVLWATSTGSSILACLETAHKARLSVQSVKYSSLSRDLELQSQINQTLEIL